MKKIAADIVSQEKDKRSISIHWFPSRGKNYGCANVRGGRCIEVHTPDDGGSSPGAIMVLLHEIAHVLAPWSSPNVQNVRSGFHGIKFWMQSQALYRRYGQLEYASRRDGYKCGRDFMLKILAGEIDDVFTTPDGSVWQLDFGKGTAQMIRRIAEVSRVWEQSGSGIGRYRTVRRVGTPGRRPNPVRKIKLVAEKLSVTYR